MTILGGMIEETSLGGDENDNSRGPSRMPGSFYYLGVCFSVLCLLVDA